MARRPAARQGDGARSRDAAFVLPLFGVLLLLPPFLNLFTRNVLLWGIPLEVVYLFGIWIALVAGAALLTRRLPRQDAEAAEPAPSPGPPDPPS